MTATRQQPRVQASLSESADRASQNAAKYPPDSWAYKTFQTLAGHLRAVGEVFDLDPTLVDEPEETGRFRVLWLIDDLGGMCERQAIRFTRPGPRNQAALKEEAEALLQRVGDLVARARVTLPYPPPTGQMRAAQTRLAAHYAHVQDAADMLRAAVVATLRVAPGDVKAGQLRRTAVGLDMLAQQLQNQHEANVDALNDALGLNVKGQADDDE